MKSKRDFETKEEYEEYLLVYFTGVALGGLLAGRTDDSHVTAKNAPYAVDVATTYAEEAVKQIMTII